MNVIFSCIIKKRCVSSPLQRARLPLLQQQVQELEAAPEEENTKIQHKSFISEHTDYDSFNHQTLKKRKDNNAEIKSKIIATDYNNNNNTRKKIIIMHLK